MIEQVSVRELILRLTQVEDALRQSRRPGGHDGTVCAAELDVGELARREQVIVYELRRRARVRQRAHHPGTTTVYLDRSTRN